PFVDAVSATEPSGPVSIWRRAYGGLSCCQLSSRHVTTLPSEFVCEPTMSTWRIVPDDVAIAATARRTTDAPEAGRETMLNAPRATAATMAAANTARTANLRRRRARPACRS